MLSSHIRDGHGWGPSMRNSRPFAKMTLCSCIVYKRWFDLSNCKVKGLGLVIKVVKHGNYEKLTTKLLWRLRMKQFHCYWRGEVKRNKVILGDKVTLVSLKMSIIESLSKSSFYIWVIVNQLLCNYITKS